MSPARKVCEELYKYPRHKLQDTDILNKALKLSLLDLLFQIESMLNQYNREYIIPSREDTPNNFSQGVYGIKHSGVGIPNYLKMFIDRKGEDIGWRQKEMEIDDMDGIAVLEFRNINEDKWDYDESRFL